MEICHSFRCKQIDISTTDQFLSIFRNNIDTRPSTFRSKCRDYCWGLEYAIVDYTLKFNSTFLRGSFDYYSLQSAHVWASQRRLEDFRCDYECRRWMRRVFDSSRSLLFKPLSSQGVCEPLMSTSYARGFDQTYELTYEHSSAKVRMNQT